MATDSPDPDAHPVVEFSRPVSLAELRAGPAEHQGTATGEECAALARRFEIEAVRDFTYRFETRSWREGLRLSGQIVATVGQTCVVTLEPMETVINETVERGFLPPDELFADVHPGAEIELHPVTEFDEMLDPLADPLDLGEIAAEALAVAIDPYPRSTDDPGDMSAAPKGVEPLTDADVKPFAALAELRAKLGGNGDE